MKYFLPFIALFLISCPYDESQLVKNPKITDLEGNWESLSILQYFPYALLNFNSDGEGILIVSNEDNSSIMLTLDSFQSLPKSFIMTATINDTDEPEEPEQIEGKIERGQLCFYLPKFEDEEENIPPFCFTRADKINGFRLRALEVLNEFSGKNTY